MRLLLASLCLFVSACAELRTPVESELVTATQKDKPKRIVSLDYCADQYVLKLADRQDILAVSPHAEDSYSYMRAAADGIEKVRPIAEDILALKPDLIVRSYGGGPEALHFFEKAGIPVVQIGWTSTLFGNESGSISKEINRVAKGIGQSERGEQLVAEYKLRLNDLRTSQTTDTSLYVAQGGVTSGSGTLVHELIELSGHDNFETRAGWHPLPLERLVYEQPDMVAAAFFDSYSAPSNYWSLSRHPVLGSQTKNADRIDIEGAWTACGSWFILDAAEALSTP